MRTDANGNQTTRTFGSDHFDLVYDAENRLVEVQKNDATIALFTFDGDGKRVKSVMDGETILFAGGHYEKKGNTITKYYMAGASRVAMRKYTIPQSMMAEYVLGDHLGSTSVTTDNAGSKTFGQCLGGDGVPRRARSIVILTNSGHVWLLVILIEVENTKNEVSFPPDLFGSYSARHFNECL